MISRLSYYLLIALVLVGLWQLALVGKFYMKALIADQLINQAWEASLEDKTEIRPWSWADTWPVAELSVPRLNIKEVVLMGDSGRVLAFGAGLTESSSIPGEAGLSVISGHRDTHFNFLKDIRKGDQLILKTHNGEMTFSIEDTAIVNQKDFVINRESFTETNRASIMLVTCYPFDALTSGGDLRFIALAKSQGRAI